MLAACSILVVLHVGVVLFRLIMVDWESESVVDLVSDVVFKVIHSMASNIA